MTVTRSVQILQEKGNAMPIKEAIRTQRVPVRIWTEKVFDQITRDVPVGRDQHADGRVLVDAVRPFEAGLKALTERHPQLLKAFGKFSK